MLENCKGCRKPFFPNNCHASNRGCSFISIYHLRILQIEKQWGKEFNKKKFSDTGVDCQQALVDSTDLFDILRALGSIILIYLIEILVIQL